MMSIRGMISIRASAFSAGSFEPSFTGILDFLSIGPLREYSPRRHKDTKEFKN